MSHWCLYARLVKIHILVQEVVCRQALLYPRKFCLWWGILFSRCPSVRQYVRPSVCPSMTLWFLAHLSRRLTRWAYIYQWSVVRPSSVRRPPSSSVVVHTFKLEYLWSQLANLDPILCVASLGWEKAAEDFGADWIKTLVSMATESPHWLIMGKTMSPPFLACFRSDPFNASNEGMHKILDEFELWPDRTTDDGVSCPWASKKIPIDL